MLLAILFDVYSHRITCCCLTRLRSDAGRRRLASSGGCFHECVFLSYFLSCKAFGEFSPHLIRSSGGPTINGSTQYRARFFCAKYETFDCVLHSSYLVGIRAEDKLKLSDDITEDDFTSTPDSRIWDFSPMRLGAAKTARESAKLPAISLRFRKLRACWQRWRP